MNKSKSQKGMTIKTLIVILIIIIALIILTVAVIKKINNGDSLKYEESTNRVEHLIDSENTTIEIDVPNPVVIDENGVVQTEIGTVTSKSLYIQLKPILNGGVIDSVRIKEENITPKSDGIYKYEVNSNGIYEFNIEGTVHGKIYNKKVNITVNQFASLIGQSSLPKGLIEGTEFIMDTDNNEETKETWIVLHKTENTIEIISKNTMGSLTLGLNDSYINWNDKNVISNVDLDKNGELSDIEKTIYSYNNSIETLNNYCDSLIKNEDVRAASLGIRSVGSLPSNPNYKNSSRPARIENLNNWSNRTAWDLYGVFGEDGDENLNDDYNKMEKLGITSCGEETSYWLASRRVYESWMDSNLSGSVSFQIRQISSDYCISTYIWKVNNIGENQINITTTSAVRPVIKLQYP